MKKYKFLGKYAKTFKVDLVITFIFIIGIAALALLPPYLSKKLIDEGLQNKSLFTIIKLGLILISIYFINFAVSYYVNLRFTKISTQFISNVKSDLFKHIIKLPINYFDNNQNGYINERIKEADSLSIIFSPVIYQFITSLISFCGAIFIMLKIKWQLTLIIVVFVPIFYYFNNRATSKFKSASKALFEINAKTSGTIQESIGAISEVKRLNIESKKIAEVNKHIAEVKQKSIQRGKYLSLGSEIMQLIMKIAAATIIIFSAIYMSSNSLTPGDYIAISQYSLLLFTPIQLLGSFMLTIQPAIVAIGRFDSIFSEQNEDEINGTRTIEYIEQIEFKNVSFSYNNDKKYAIKNLSFKVNRNDKIQISGQNGAGKSTILKLILGFYKNYEGEIYINNIDIRDIDVESIRKTIGMVAQDLFVFSGTIMDNIKITSEIKDDLKIKEILINNEILDKETYEKLKDKLVAEGGKNLSGGERQKIAISRVVLKNPSLIIFDEATSNLDIQSKNDVEGLINTTFKDKICIIISHNENSNDAINKNIKIS